MGMHELAEVFSQSAHFDSSLYNTEELGSGLGVLLKALGCPTGLSLGPGRERVLTERYDC